MNHSPINVRIRAGSVPEVREVRIYQGVLGEREVRALYQRIRGETTLGGGMESCTECFATQWEKTIEKSPGAMVNFRKTALGS